MSSPEGMISVSEDFILKWISSIFTFFEATMKQTPWMLSMVFKENSHKNMERASESTLWKN